MKLKAHLNFIGDRKTETISVNKPGYPYEILEIEVFFNESGEKWKHRIEQI